MQHHSLSRLWTTVHSKVRTTTTSTTTLSTTNQPCLYLVNKSPPKEYFTKNSRILSKRISLRSFVTHRLLNFWSMVKWMLRSKQEDFLNSAQGDFWSVRERRALNSNWKSCSLGRSCLLVTRHRATLLQLVSVKHTNFHKLRTSVRCLAILEKTALISLFMWDNKYLSLHNHVHILKPSIYIWK